MSKHEIERVYQCLACGQIYSKKQALRAHWKKHKNEGYIRSSIFVLGKDWADFEEIAKKHKTTTCRLLSALIAALRKGEELGITTIASENPALIQVNHVFLGAPRGRYSHVDPGVIGRSIAQGDLEPVGCPFIGGLRPGQVLCRKSGSRWQSRAECSSCSSNWIKFPYTRKCQ